MCGLSCGLSGVFKLEARVDNNLLLVRLILTSCRKRTSGQSCRASQARKEAGPAVAAPSTVDVAASPLRLKKAVMGADDCGTKGWMPSMFQE